MFPLIAVVGPYRPHRLGRVQADPADSAVVTQSILRFRRVISGKDDRDIVPVEERGARRVHPCLLYTSDAADE